MSWRMGLLCLALAHGLSHARAQDAESRVSSQFWQRAKQPNTARAQSLLRQARALLLPALRVSTVLGTQSAAHKRLAIEGAITRLERARVLTPKEPELLYLLGRAYAAWQGDPQHAEVRRTQEAIACLIALRRVDPWYEAEAVAFELGVLRTRDAQFAQAVDEYAQALASSLDKQLLSSTLGNLAEVTMLAGDVQQALALYERAIGESEGDERLLLRWGWVVALDRAGEQSRALEEAQQALREEPNPQRLLEQSSVFFAPAFERDYYDAMVALAQAESSSGAAHEEQLSIALNAFERYAQAAGASGLWTHVAQDHVDRLRTLLSTRASNTKKHALHGQPKRTR